MNKYKDTKMKSIQFNTEMVKAILEDRKTVTRRVIKQIPNHWHFSRRIMDWYLSKVYVNEFDGETLNFEVQCDVDDSFMATAKAPYKVGDILYVKENWKKYDKMVGTGDERHLESFIGYKANKNAEVLGEFFESKWKSPACMPKAVARIFLKVNNVRVERLQDITETDARNEGVRDPYDYFDSLYWRQFSGLDCEISAFVRFWNATLKKKDLDERSWDANPYVWVIEFEKIEKEEV